MKVLITALLLVVASFTAPTSAPTTADVDNYKVTKTRTKSYGKSYDIKCTDCGKYITVYYKKKTGKYSRGDSPWYKQHRSLDKAATAGCNNKCD